MNAKAGRRIHATPWVRAMVMGGLYAVLVVPIGILVLHAFTTRWFYPQLLPQEWSLEPFWRQLTLPENRMALGTGVQVALATSLLSLLIAYPAARVLATRDFAGRGWVTILFFIPTVVPPIAMGMGLNILFLRLGLAGTLAGVILVHLIPVLPYTIFTLSSLFSRYDLNYEYQAVVLGAGRARTFFTVTVPLVLPGVVVALLFAFLVSWSQYLLTLLIGGGHVLTLPVLLFAAVAGGNPTTIAILSLLFIAPPLLVIAATARYLTVESGQAQQSQY
jgi:putative spermidine/putrescine transport system permease protein